uniref:Retrotransposon gag domain-containing protein n=1 Tax=Astyanax mexicanus TaxID=7994 RepID=A0A3B1K3I8_ASTMX
MTPWLSCSNTPPLAPSPTEAPPLCPCPSGGMPLDLALTPSPSAALPLAECQTPCHALSRLLGEAPPSPSEAPPLGLAVRYGILPSANQAPVSSPASAPSAAAFPVSKPDKYDGSPDLCRGFLLQMSLFFVNSPVNVDAARISFFISCLTGKALDWATAIWPSIEGSTYEHFLKEFKLVFDHPHHGQSQGELLVKLRQGNRSVSDFALEFRTLAAGSGWNEPALRVMFRNGSPAPRDPPLFSRGSGLVIDQGFPAARYA